MGCVATKLEEEGQVVAICRDRKRLLKQAVERRRALAAAHFKYCQSLYAVSAAIKLFVARHASPSSPFLITFPPSSSLPPPEAVTDGSSTTTTTTTTTAMFLQQKPSESTSKSEAVRCPSCVSSSESSEDEEGHNVLLHAGAGEQPYGYSSYYMQTPPPMPSPPRDFGWDFFNLFDAMRPEVVSGYTKTATSYDEELRVVRQQEGIPELEEEDKKVVVVEENPTREEVNNGSSKQVEMVKVVDSLGLSQEAGNNSELAAGKGRDLLEALRDIESHFMRAYDSGKDVCRMLEANSLHLHSGREELKVNPTKIIQAIAWQRSASFKLGSCKSLVASSSTWSEYKNDLFDDDYGGMVSGSHSLTLARLYAWEKKLYEEVKAGDGVRKLYEKKCMRMRNQDVRVDNRFRPDKTRAAVKDLYARILVSIRSAESISGKIEKLRDEELQPQIIELLKGMTNTWKTMVETHETQKKILTEVGTFDCPLYGKFCNDSHRLATLQLEAELHNWRSCLAEYVTAQKSYVETLHRWLTKFLAPEVELYSRSGKRASSGPYRATGPGLLPVCHEWLSLLEKLPDKSVGFALKSFAKDLRALRDLQGEELQQKRKVETLAKELEKRTQAFKKIETRLLEYRPTTTEEKHEPYDEPDPIETLRRRVDAEREKHQRFVREAERATLIGFRAGFCAVFESLTEFGMASQKMYNEIAMCGDKVEKSGGLLGSSGDGDQEGRR